MTITRPRVFAVLAVVGTTAVVGSLFVFKQYFGDNLNSMPVDASVVAPPALPQEYVNTDMPTQSGTVITVNAGGDFQAALNAAMPGDTIVLAAGATFSGNFTLPAKANPDNKWVVIKSSQADQLPDEGNRVSPSDAGRMPKLTSPNPTWVIAADQGASYYRFIGIEITDNGASSLYGPALPGGGTGGFHQGLIALGQLGRDTELSHLPHHIIFDRSFIHGQPTTHVKYGVGMNGKHLAVIDSHLSDLHGVGQDTQAIVGYNGVGPFKITNNYLAASGENVMFGGADPSLPNAISSDVEIRNNYFHKPLSWKVGHATYAGIHWSVKNIFETKNIQRLIFENNILENSWADAQTGFGLVLKSSNQDGACPWCVSQDLTIRNNIIRNTDNGVSLAGLDLYNGGTGIPQRRVLLENNLFENVGERILQITAESTTTMSNIAIRHNTFWSTTDSYNLVTLGDGAPVVNGLNITDNVFVPSTAGTVSVKGSGQTAGLPSLDYYADDYTMAGNILVINSEGANALPQNHYTTKDAAGFTNAASGNYALTSTSPYKNAGIDGTDPGANYAAVLAATTNTISGQGNGSTPPPAPEPPAPAPVINSFTASPSTITTGSASTLSWSVSDATSLSINQGVGTVTGTSKSVSPTATTTYTLTATNSVGSVTKTVTLTVNPAGDTAAPTVSITAPAANATVSGSSVTISATASDNVGVVGVQFKVDGSNIGVEDTSAPYSVTWNTTSASNGSHAITAVARDAANNSTTSTSVNVSVNNTVAPSKVTTPSISPTGGSYSSAQSVTMSTSTSGAAIRYTTDGTTPNSSSNLYSSAITVSSTTTIKAIATKSGMTDSEVASATYTISIPSSGGGSGGGSSTPKPSIPVPVVPPKGTDFVCTGKPTVYYMHNTEKEAYPDAAIYEAWNGKNYSIIKQYASDVCLNTPGSKLVRLPEGTIIRVSNGPEIYRIEGNMARPFTNYQAYIRDAASKPVVIISIPYLHTYPRGANIE